MGTVFDYLTWRGDLSFENDKVNSVDLLIFSLITYMNFEGFVPNYPSNETKLFSNVVNEIFKVTPKEKMSLGVIVPKDNIYVTYKASKVDRYSNVLVSNYINYINEEESCQFSAICYHLSSKVIVVSFRGTDDTLIGWKENLDMICNFPIKAQKLACDYLDKINELYPNANIYVIGHSKGGNLATYATIYCKDETKDKIIKCLNYDGPGFVSKFVDNNKFERIKNKIFLYITKDDIVGVLFDGFYGHLRIIDSKDKWIEQHNGATWLIEGNHFKKVKTTTDASKGFNESVDDMLEKLNDTQKEELANQVYKYILDIKSPTLSDLQKGRSLTRVFSVFKDISFKNRKLFTDFVFNFIRYGIKKEKYNDGKHNK